MAVSSLKSGQITPRPEGRKTPGPPASKKGFHQALSGLTERPGEIKPPSALAQEQLEAIKAMVKLELMNLNTCLFDALRGGPAGAGGKALDVTGMGAGLSGLAGFLQVLKFLPLNTEQQPVEKTKAKPSPQSQKIAAGDKNPPSNQAPPGDLDEIINKAAQSSGLDPNLVKAVIKTESDFNPAVVSKAGAMGLMQLMPFTAKELGVADPFDPEGNVFGGTRYLRQMLDRFSGNLDQALAAYNWGPGNLERSTGSMPEETQNYIKLVNRYYKMFAGLDQA